MTSGRKCFNCPRACGVDRRKTTGFCKAGEDIRIARAALHHWEEPCLTGKNGSGAVFFSGCTLRCVFCQNRQISDGLYGRDISVDRLSEIFLELQDQGAANINLVTADMYSDQILEALQQVQSRLKIPVMYNCSGYQTEGLLERLAPYVSIFLPDLKYYSPELSGRYSSAPDYFEKASRAIKKMIEISGPPVFDEDGIMQRGTIVRHLVLPGCRKDSMELMRWMSEELPRDGFLISVMSQYTPDFLRGDFKELKRRVTSFEYNSVVDEALRLGLDKGFMQERSSAKDSYTPAFDLEGV